MNQFNLAEIIQATRGRLLQGDGRVIVSGIATDTRSIKPGELFIALNGENFNGHHFVTAAANAGAGAAVVMAEGDYPSDLTLVRVADTTAALGDIARFHRKRFPIPLIGITGSNGKTTTKDFIAAVLAQEKTIVKTEGNFNNEIGLPLTLLKIGADTEIAVVEMGMRGLGQIARLAQIAFPDIGIITNVGLSHLEILGSQENIARAKAELIEALPQGGLAITNGDDPLVRKMKAGAGVKTVYYGIEAADLDCRADEIRPTNEGMEFTVSTKRGEISLRLPLPGRHNIYNALAAVALAVELGITTQSIRNGLAQPNLTGRRLKITKHQGFSIIDDTYNASPTSVMAALQVLSQSGPGRKIAVLADMLELGPDAATLHYQLGRYAGEHGVDQLFGFGELAREYVTAFNGIYAERGEYFSDKAQLIARLREFVQPGDYVLVKGSRGMKMEEVVADLSGEGTKAPCRG